MNWSWRGYSSIVFIDISYVYLFKKKKKNGINSIEIKNVVNILIFRKKSKDNMNNKNQNTNNKNNYIRLLIMNVLYLR